MNRTWKERVRNFRGKQLAAQCLRFNRHGGARTYDHLMVPASTSRGRLQKSGAYKEWTPEAICKAAEMSATCTARTLAAACDGSHLHAARTRLVYASVVMEAQTRSKKRPRLDALRSECPLDFYITNNMFDETKLRLEGYGRSQRSKTWKRVRVLASHAQVTWQAAGSDVTDIDVIRPPKVLRRYTAACQLNVVAGEGDSASLLPLDRALPPARYYGHLLSSDMHSVNVLTSKWVGKEIRALPGNHFHVAAYCTQHKTGSVVETITKQLGLLSPCFCIASVLKHGDVCDDLQELLESIIPDILDVVDHPIELDEHEQRQADFADALMEACYVCGLSAEDDYDDTDIEAHIQRRRAEKSELRSFFPGPWKGPVRVVVGGRRRHRRRWFHRCVLSFLS